jgi:predicted ATPase
MDFSGFISEVSIKTPDDAKHLYPFNIPAFKNMQRLAFHPRVTYIIGENGTGKSTLIEALAINLGFNAEGGSKNFNFSTQNSHSDLHANIQITKSHRRLKDGFFLRSESFYNLANAFNDIAGGNQKFIASYGGKSLHHQSHGEAFWALFMNRFRGNGLYILDEPEAALSIHRQMAMISRIHALSPNSQFIIATHSPIILAYPEAIIYEMSDSGFKAIKYQDTDIFKVTKGFLNNLEPTLQILLDQPAP